MAIDATVVVGRRSAAWAPLAVGAAGLLAAGYVRAVSPFESGHYPLCPVLALTGLYCAGCGSLRAVHSLGNGDAATAWDMNPFAVVAAPLVVAAWVAWLVRALTGRPKRWVAPAWSVWALLGAIIAFSALRNVPLLAPWLAP